MLSEEKKQEIEIKNIIFQIHEPRNMVNICLF